MVKLGFVGDLLKPLQHYIKFPKIWIDNSVFRLHCKATAFMIFVSCTVVSVGQFFGDPIDCIVDTIPQGVMDTYCWIHSTFTLPKHVKGEIGWEVAHPGVAPVLNYEEEVVEHKFYQWVCFTLFVQGVCFLLPYSLWKRWEGGRVAKLIPQEDLCHALHDSRMPGFATAAALIEKQKAQIAIGKMKDYFITKNHFNYREHRHYFLKFTFCEFLNFVNVLCQIFFLDLFLGGVFTTYGSDVLAMSQEDPENRNDPLNSVFPKVAKCTFNKYGPSGTIENYDGLCILSLNIINEKIYILLWFWFVFLSTVSAIQLVWRAFSIISGRMREFILRGQSRLLAGPDDVTLCCYNMSMGDWFILVQIGNNIDSHIYADLIQQIARSFKKIMDEEDEAFTNV